MLKTYTIGLYEKAMPNDLSWKDKLLTAKESNYDYVEISIDESEDKIKRVDMSKEERLKMVQWMYETDMPVRSMCVSALTKYSLGNSDEELCKRGMDIARKAIKLADDLGIRVVMIPGYDVYYTESTADTQQRFIYNLKVITEIAAGYGVIIGLETMENNFMNTVWKAMYYVQQIDSVYLNVYPDSGNLKNAAVSLGNSEIQDLLAGKGHITSLHLKETVPGKFREIPYGAGHVDFQKIIETAWAIGIRKYVTEFWYKGGQTWKEDIRQVNSMMRAILDKIAEEGREGGLC